MVSLYRGFHEVLPPGEQLNIFRNVPRTPTHSDLDVHRHADSWFLKRFGVSARSTTIICSTDLSQARSYGATYRIIPSEPLLCIYSPGVRDFLEHEIDLSSTSRADVWAWLDSKQYGAVDSVGAISEDFFGEVMVCCAKFVALLSK